MKKKILDDRSLLTKIKDGKLRVKECLNTSLYEYSMPSLSRKTSNNRSLKCSR